MQNHSSTQRNAKSTKSKIATQDVLLKIFDVLMKDGIVAKILGNYFSNLTEEEKQEYQDAFLRYISEVFGNLLKMYPWLYKKLFNDNMQIDDIIEFAFLIGMLVMLFDINNPSTEDEQNNVKYFSN